MRISQIFRITWSNLKGKRVRTILTILGIAVGMGAIVFLVSLGYGLQQFTIKRISSISSLSTLTVSQGKTISIILDSSMIKKIEKINGVEKVVSVLASGGVVKFGDKKLDIVAIGTGSDYFIYEDTKFIAGNGFSDNENKIVVSSALVKNMGEDFSSVISKEVFLSVNFKDKNGKYLAKDLKVVIAGVVDDETSIFAYYPIKLIEELIDENTVFSSLKAKVQTRESVMNVKKEIENMGFSVASIAETVKQIDVVFRYVRIILATFGAIALLVAAIGMFNTMTIALLERTRDIGIMKAVGVNNKDIYLMFLLESVLISSLGGILGSGFGTAFSYLVNAGINYLAKIVGAEPVILFSTPLSFIGIIIIFSIFVGILTGIYPSRRAANINPLDALRYE